MNSSRPTRDDAVGLLDAKETASSPNEPWAFVLILVLAFTVLVSVDRWMTVLEAWSDRGSKGNEVLARALVAVLSTAVAAGAWYVLAFVVLPL